MDDNNYLDIGENFEINTKYENLEFLNLKKIIHPVILSNTYNKCIFNNELLINVELIETNSFVDCVFKKIIHINIKEDIVQHNAFINCKFESIIYVNVHNLNMFNHCEFNQIIVSGVKIDIPINHGKFDNIKMNNVMDNKNKDNDNDIVITMDEINYTNMDIKKIVSYELANNSYINIWFSEEINIDVKHIYSSAFVNCVFEKNVYYINHENGDMDIFENCTFLEKFITVNKIDEKTDENVNKISDNIGKLYIMNKINEFKNKNINRTNMLFLGIGNRF